MVDSRGQQIAFVTYETPFAPGGGIAAVMRRLPGFVRAASGLETIVVTPFHHRIARTATLPVSHVGTVHAPFQGRQVPVRILRHDAEWPWYFLQPEGRWFFSGLRHPYDVSPAHLARDALFFGEAAASALLSLGQAIHWNVFLQDWEAATVALAWPLARRGRRLFLTLHNTYDSSIDGGATVLERTLPFIESPVFTVSEQFALDITGDLFQREVVAPHLQEMLRFRLRGVNNGPFVDLAVPEDILRRASGGDFAPLREWKAANRRQALAALRDLAPSAERPVWGNLARFGRDEACWFVMAGRDDPRQKGYDVAAAAVRAFLQDGGTARFLFFPIPGDEGLDGLGFLRSLAADFPESVLVFPFHWAEGFSAALRGAAYGLMPSLYEPFGMANEFYLNGTVGIGRATGGILQQIVPLWASACFSPAVSVRAAQWHAMSAHPTGLLFRERDDLQTARQDWEGINAARYDRSGEDPPRPVPARPGRIAERWRYPLFRGMVYELRLAIADGVRVYREDPTLYYRMLTEGISYIRRSFSWERAAQEYVRSLVG